MDDNYCYQRSSWQDRLALASAARGLDIPTKDLLRLIFDREIRYVMVDDIAHVPATAVDDYRARAS